MSSRVKRRDEVSGPGLKPMVHEDVEVPTRGYFRQLADSLTQGWNEFWFRESDVLPLSVLRALVGLFAVLWLLSLTPELLRWFGPAGLLPVETVQEILSVARPGQPVFEISILNWAHNTALLCLIHAASLVVLLALAVGIFTRLATVASLVVALSYVHRAPMITSHIEPVMTMLIAYLCLAPTGRCLSADRWWRRRVLLSSTQECTSVWANIALRLIQVHICAFYLLMAFTKLAGVTWWSGDAMWWLIVQPESALVDFTWMGDYLLLVNLWTHAVVLVELAFPILVWNRLLRPLVLAVSVLHWVLLAAATGLVGFAAIMVMANCAFVPAATWRAWLRGEKDDGETSKSAT